MLVISHGGTNRALMSTALGITPAHYHQFEQSNCAVNVLSFLHGRAEFGKLEAMNFTHHVGEKLPQLKDKNRGLRLLLISAETEQEEQILQLTQFLKNETINFSISGDSEHSRSISEEILQHHPEIIKLQVLQENFLQLWQQSINTKKQTKSNHQLTGLIVAKNIIIKQSLGQILGLNPEQLWRLNLQTGTVSVIHYPNS